MADFHIVATDNAPPISATLTDAEGNVANLNNATVEFVMTAIRGATGAKVDAAGVVEDGDLGTVHYDWQGTDLDTEGGYYAHWRVTYSNGKHERFPSDHDLTLAIHHDIRAGSSTHTTKLLATTEAFAEARGVRHDPADVKALRALEDASALFRSLAHQTISQVADDVAELRGNWSRRLWLPERPVTAVTALTLIDEWNFSWVVAPSSLRISRRGLVKQAIWGPTWGGAWGGPDATVRVTYTHGYAVIPDDVVATVLTLAARRLKNLISAQIETISAWTVDFGGLSVEEQGVIRKYRPLEA